MIERIEVFVTELPVRLQRVFSSGNYDTGPLGRVLGKPVLVRIHADGVVGTAQIRPIAPGHFVADTTHSSVAAITEVLGPAILGKDLFDIEGINEACDLRLHGNPAARAVLDIALHDAMGKALGLPVHKLIGGACQPHIPLEWSVSMADDVGVIIAEATRAVEEFGIKVLCLKAADRRGWRQDVRHFEAVRRAVGEDVVIGVDPNTGWTVPDAISAIHALRPFDLGYVEQPIARRDLKGMAAIRRECAGIPLMADEGLFTLQDAYALAEAEAVDAFCIKLYKVGGLSAARKIAAVAEASNILLNCGGIASQSQLEAAATAHFYASIPARRMMGAGEFVLGLNTTAPDPLVPETDFVVKDGYADVPTGPGLGITIDENALKKYTLRHEVVK
ncbi:enolase C-terminal domain-like protein [Pigmentiphaga soli]|uniref:Enolase C-terminal domain-like protein n=1 Tax=Pigmentiphaga soli TaxID=1007095 RepID=A0ABP8H4V0_9BURK